MQEAWREISSGINYALLQGSVAPLTTDRWLRIHTLVYQLASNQDQDQGQRLYSSLRDLLSVHVSSVARRLSQIPIGIQLLRDHSNEWVRYHDALLSLYDVFGYLNRTWTKKHGRRGIAPLPGVFDTTTQGLVIWRQLLTDPLESSLRQPKPIPPRAYHP